MSPERYAINAMPGGPQYSHQTFTMLFKLLAIVAALGVIAAPTIPGSTELASLEIRATGGGLNDYSCKAQDGKLPIVFLHGLGAPAGINWIAAATNFASQGYCTFYPQYGTVGIVGLGFKSVPDNSAEVSGDIQKVLASTGASKIHLVGHSLGTLVSQYYIKFDGGDKVVQTFTGLGSVVHGTTMAGLTGLLGAIPGYTDLLKSLCLSCSDVMQGSDLIKKVENGGMTRPGILYTSIMSKLDQAVLPYTNGYINETGVTNVVLQDHCAIDYAGHLLQSADPNVISLMDWTIKGKQGALPGCVPWLLWGRDVDEPKAM